MSVNDFAVYFERIAAVSAFGISSSVVNNRQEHEVGLIFSSSIFYGGFMRLKRFWGKIRDSRLAVGIFFVLLGLVLMLSSQADSPILGDQNSPIRTLLYNLGLFAETAVVTSWLYETFLIEKHFSQFRQLVNDEIRSLDTVQSKALKLGIVNLYTTRSDFESDYPFSKLLEDAGKGGRILCVARTLFHFLNKEHDVKTALRLGAQFDLVCLDPTPEAIPKVIKELTAIYRTDIGPSIENLRRLAKWATEEKPPGGIELHYHTLYLPDSCLIIQNEKKETIFVVWDLSFGRDLPDKRVIVMDAKSKTLGNDLLKRYENIWNTSVCMFKMKEGKVETNVVFTPTR